MTTKVSHADASVRVDALRTQLSSLDAEIAAATKQKDDHECEAVLTGAEIDTSFRNAVLELHVKRLATSNLLRTLEGRLEAIREQEESAKRAAKRKEAEDLFAKLLELHREKTQAAITAVFLAARTFADLLEIRAQMALILDADLRDTGRRAPVLFPGSLNLLRNGSIDTWAQDVCAFGYADMVPDSSLGKKRFINSRQKELHPETAAGANAINTGTRAISANPSKGSVFAGIPDF